VSGRELPPERPHERRREHDVADEAQADQKDFLQQGLRGSTGVYLRKVKRPFRWNGPEMAVEGLM